MVKDAIQKMLTDANPFSDVKIDLNSDRSKNFFVSPDIANRVLDECPSKEWRAFFALGRWGGLRIPSEINNLLWRDIDYTANRMVIRSPKTERYGKACRVVPIFVNLRRELDALKNELLQSNNFSEDSKVIPMVRDGVANMRKRLSKIVEESGCTVWQKPFMALRSSLRTELQDSRKFSDVQLNNWFGHTTKIAERYYYIPTEEGFENAARYESKLKLSSVVQQSAQQGPERTSQGELQNVESDQTMAVSPERYPKKCPSATITTTCKNS